MKYFERDYLQLKSAIAEMGIMAAKMNHDSIRSLLEKDSKLALEVIEKDSEIDALDISIEELCMKILALYEPKAIDLRNILTASRIIVDLERIGDYCVNICRETLDLNRIEYTAPFDSLIDIESMRDKSSKMIRDVMTAYFERDLDIAEKTILEDDAVDKLHAKILTDLLTEKTEHSGQVQSILKILVICRSLERIADHVVNIAEMVHFMVTGNSIRHSKLKRSNNEQNTSN